MSVCRMDDSEWCIEGTCFECDKARRRHYAGVLSPAEVEVEKLERRLREQGSTFCETNQREVDRTNAIRLKYEHAMSNVTEALYILTMAMMGRDPTRRELTQVRERLQRVIKRDQ